MTKEQILSEIRAKRVKFIAFLLSSLAIVTMCVLAGIFFFHNTLILFLAVSVLALTLFLTATNFNKLKAPFVITQRQGIIRKCHIEKFERNTMKTTSYSLVRKPYSNYFEDSYALSLFIEADGKTLMKRAKNLSFAVCDYYKVGDRVLLISGCPLPLPLDSEDKRIINPITCEFI